MPSKKELSKRKRDAKKARDKAKRKLNKARKRDAPRKRRRSLKAALDHQRKRLAKIVRQLLRKKHKRTRVNWNGHPSNVTAQVREAALLANQHGLYVTSTTDLKHASGSWHYAGRAADFGGTYSNMVAFQREAAKKWGGALEIFGPDAFYIKNGRLYNGHFPNHGDHVHVAR